MAVARGSAGIADILLKFLWVPRLYNFVLVTRRKVIRTQ
jgi:hypothetical protein